MKFAGFIIGVALVVIGFWLDGYNFDSRGEKAVLLYLMCLFTGIIFSIVASLIDENFK